MQNGVNVIDLGGLQVELRPRPGMVDVFDARIDADTGVFAGGFDEMLSKRDLGRFADALDELGDEGDVSLGGGRAAEIRLQCLLENSVGPAYVVECSITRTADDPQVVLKFLLFGVDRSSLPSSGPIRQLLSTTPWPVA